MTKPSSWFIIIIFLVVTSGHLCAQTTNEIDLSKPLTLEQCITVALENATSIKNAQLDLAIEELRRKNVKASYYPEISIGAHYNSSDQIDFGFEKENYDSTITGRYILWDHGQRKANLAQAKASLNATQSRNIRTQQQLIFDIIQAYYNLLKAQKLVEVDEELLKQSKKNTEKVKTLMELGYLVEADVAAAEAQEANDELNLLFDQNALEISMAHLPTLMGLGPGSLLQVQDDPDYETYAKGGPIKIETIKLNEAIKKAENRPEFPEMRENIKSLEWGLTLAKLQRYPRLTAQYEHGVLLDDYLREGENFKDFRNWTFLATLTFPLFDGGVSKRQVQQVKLQLEQSHENERNLERSIAFEVRQAYLTLKSSEKALIISGKQVKNARLSLDVINGKFEKQVATLLELLNAQALYAQALTNQVRAFYDYKIAKSALQKAMGELRSQ